MKLTIVQLTHFSRQEHIDLARIWPRKNISTLESQLNNIFHLYVARFNDRLLAAVTLEIQGISGYLRDFLVREPTRRRGVGHYLLQEVLAQNPTVCHWLVTHHGTEDPDASAAFMQYSGFHAQPEGWVFNR
ncbi:aspartate 1-decarboxylase autocleavage activator PanM [Enterobacteriaceae bacterium LUAb1]